MYEQEDNQQEPNNAKIRKMVQERMKRLQIEEQKKNVMQKLLDPAAYNRLMNIRLSNRELFDQVMDLIISLAQSNRIQGRLTEKQLIGILERVTYKKEPTLQFKHK